MSSKTYEREVRAAHRRLAETENSALPRAKRRSPHTALIASFAGVLAMGVISIISYRTQAEAPDPRPAAPGARIVAGCEAPRFWERLEATVEWQPGGLAVQCTRTNVYVAPPKRAQPNNKADRS